MFNRYSKSLFFALLSSVLFLPSLAFATSFNVELSSSVEKVSTGKQFFYTIKYRCASTTEDCNSVTVQAVLDSKLDDTISKVDVVGSPHTNSNTYDQSTHTALWIFDSPLSAGATGELKLYAQFRAGDVGNGEVATLAVTTNSVNAGVETSNTVNVTAEAESNWSLVKSRRTSNATTDQAIEYRLRVCPNKDIIGKLNLLNATLTDTLPVGTTYVSSTNSGVYDGGSHTVTWSLGNIEVGSKCFYRYVTMNYPSTTFSDNERVTNNATLSGTPYGTADVYNVSDDYSHRLQSAKPITVIQKKGDTYIKENETINYYFNIYNKGSAEQKKLILYDDVDPHVTVTKIRSGLPSAGNDVLQATILYYTNKSIDWEFAQPSDPIFLIGPNVEIDVDDLSLDADEYITRLKWEFDQVPAGFSMTGNTSAGFEGIVTAAPNGGVGDTLSSGDVLINCVKYYRIFANDSQNWREACRRTIIALENQPQPFLTKKIYGSQKRFNPEEEVTFELFFKNHSNADQALSNPVFSDFLPAELEYVSGSSTVVSKPSGAPDPTLEVIDNYKSTGRQLLHWKWTGTQAYDLAINKSFKIRFNAKIKQGTAPGYVENYIYITDWDNTGVKPRRCKWVADSNDLNDDGSTTDKICLGKKYARINVNDVAAMEASKYVRGTNDNDWVSFPTAGNTIPGGSVDYKLVVENIGNITMKNLEMFDIFPVSGDTGVIDTNARGSQWGPQLIGSVTAPDGVKVYYSQSSNPCRYELVATGPAGCEEPNWTTVIPDDISSVKALRFSFETVEMDPLDSMEITWPMKSPLNAPMLQEPAWNSFGYIAKRVDNNQSLLASEPFKVEIGNVPDQPARFGNYVWKDINGNGIQDETASDGINNVRVEVYQDNGDNIANASVDPMLYFTMTGDDTSGNPGYFQFTELAAGCYFYKVIPIDNHIVTTQDQGGDDNLDSDVYPGTYVTNVTCLTINETNYTVDVGLAPSNSATIGNYIWNDADSNGTQNESSSNGVNGVTVNLYDNANTNLATTATENDIFGNPGYYEFTGLQNGDYYVCLTLPSGASMTTKDVGGDDTIDSDFDTTTKCSDTFSITAYGTYNTYDAGVIMPGGSGTLGNLVWLDNNNNGALDGGESGIDGVKMNLYLDTDANGVYTPGTDEFRKTTTTFTKTGVPGSYEFTNLPDGDYIIQIDESNFNSVGELYLFTSSSGVQTPSNAVDDDDNGYPLANHGVIAAKVTISGGNTDNTIDFGIIDPQEIDPENDADGDLCDDSIDQHPNDPERCFETSYPGPQQHYMLTYEDRFPLVGDGDFNDLVVAYNYEIVTNSDGLMKELKATYKPLARGASYDHSFRLGLDLTSEAQYRRVLKELSDDSVTEDEVFELVEGRNELEIFESTKEILFDEAEHHLTGGFANTAYHEYAQIEGQYAEITVTMEEPMDVNLLGTEPYDVYLYVHDTEQDIHLPGYEKIEDSNNAPGFDDFIDANGYPWAMLVPADWKYPLERTLIDEAYSNFSTWRNSSGGQSQDWYMHPVPVEDHKWRNYPDGYYSD